MSYNRLVIAAFLSTVIISNSCKKDNEAALPRLTFEGKNTFGCKVNGISWVPTGYFDLGFGNYVPPTGGGLYPVNQNTKFDIYISANSQMTAIVIYLKNNSGSKYPVTRKYNLNETGCFAGLRAFGGVYDDYLHTGWVELLKVDSLNNIISGRFEFDAFDYVKNRTDKITVGRFDFKTH